jgi:hypothetical protein
MFEGLMELFEIYYSSLTSVFSHDICANLKRNKHKWLRLLTIWTREYDIQFMTNTFPH